jgi:hypothetical protein
MRREYLGHRGVDGMIILKRILAIWVVRVWTDLIVSEYCPLVGFVNTVMDSSPPTPL